MNLERLQKIAEGANPGPWKSDLGNWDVESENESTCRHKICAMKPCDREFCGETNPIDSMYDAEHIATFNPELVLAMIAEIRAARSYVDKVHGEDGSESAKWHAGLRHFEAREKLDKLLEELK